MKKISLFLLCIFFYLLSALIANKAKAQNVGINATGATPNSSAALDIDFTNKGFLIPRVALTSTASASPITTPATSLLVYNTATAGSGATAVVPGFYYWDGLAWTKLAIQGATATDWTTTGNLGTNPTSNFIGTTDNQDLVMRTNNSEKFRVTSNGRLGVNVPVPNSTIHVRTYIDGITSNEFDGLKLLSPMAAPIYNSGTIFGIDNGSVSGTMGQNAEVWNFEQGYLRFGTRNIERMRIDANGSFGFNETTAVSTITMRPYINAVFPAPYDGLRIIHPTAASTVTNGLLLGVDPTGINASLVSYQSGFLSLGTNGTERMRVTPTGTVGIGHTAPVSTLTIQDNIGVQPGLTVTSAFFPPGTNGMLFGLDQFSQTSGKIWNYMSGDIQVGVQSGEVMRVASNRKVGIGTTTPSELLDVAGKTKTQQLQVTTGAVMNYVLTSDPAGNASWQPIPTPTIVNTAWDLTGNSGTNASFNFIGTTDNVDVVMRRDNDEGFRLAAGGAILATGNSTTGVTPASGAGRRMMWIPAKSAFRVGEVTSNYWDDANIGNKSIALGIDAKASGYAAVAIGEGNIASGGNSTALGWNVTTSSPLSIGIGFISTASGFNSIVIGQSNTASGTGAIAIGDAAIASGDSTTAIGVGLTASGKRSLALGNDVSTGGFRGAFIIGDNSTSTITNSTAANQLSTRFNGGYIFYNDAALTTTKTIVFNNGNLGVGTLAPGAKLDVLGSMRTGGNGTDGQFMLYSEQGATDYTYTINPHATATQSVTLTLPPDDGNANQVLMTDGSGNLSWSNNGSSSDWGLTGNAGTTAGTNFVGTTDNVALEIRTNNIIRTRITTKGQIETMNTGQATFLGEGAGANDDLSLNRSTFVGWNAGTANTTGFQNAAFGWDAFSFNVIGNNNTAIGNGALKTSTGSGNTSIGMSSGYFTTGANNTYIGYGAGDAVTTGSSNISIGATSDVPSSTGSYQLSIGNLIYGTGLNGTDAIISTGNIGIGNNAPAFKLDVMGSIRTGGAGTDGQVLIYSEQGATDYTYTINPNAAATQNVTLTLPADDGTLNQLLTTDGGGNLSWTTPASATGWTLAGNATTNDPAAPATYGTSTIGGTENYVGTTDAQDLVFGTNNIERMRVKQTNGNVGIGTAAPTEALHVYKVSNADKSAIFSYASQTAVSSPDYQNRAITGIAKGGNANWGYAIGVAGVADQTNSYYTTGVYAGLGTVAPSNISGDQALYADAANLGYSGIFLNGNVGIGTTGPAAQLDVAGTTKIGTLGTVLTNIIKTTNNADVTSVAANSSLAFNYTVTNAAVGSTVSISPANALNNGLVIAYARVSAANTIEVKFTNVTGAAIDPPIMDYYITVIR